MSTKFFNNIESTLMDKFHGIASAMANFDIFHAVVGYFRSSGYFKLRQELDATQEIKILVGINNDNLFRQSQAAGKLFFGDKEVSLEQYCEDFLRDVYQSEYSSEVDEGIRQFCEDVSSGRLQLRIHPTKDLHAKFYLCLPKNHNEHSDGWVIMGSSNLSAQGLGTTEPPRYELNVAMKDYDDVHYCEEEFQRLWNDAIPVTLEHPTIRRIGLAGRPFFEYNGANSRSKYCQSMLSASKASSLPRSMKSVSIGRKSSGVVRFGDFPIILSLRFSARFWMLYSNFLAFIT